MTFAPLGSAAAGVVEKLRAKLEADAEQLAASYNYDVDALYFQYQRRSFGSVTTTPEGSPEQRDRYLRAWKLAVARRDAA